MASLDLIGRDNVSPEERLAPARQERSPLSRFEARLSLCLSVALILFGLALLSAGARIWHLELIDRERAPSVECIEPKRLI